MHNVRPTHFSVKVFYFVTLVWVTTGISSLSVAGPREDFEKLRMELQSTPDDNELRDRIIAAGVKLRPRPILPEEAERLLARGEAAIARARGAEDYLLAVKEFKAATTVAPWYETAYFNLGVAQEKAGQPREAIASFRRYLLAAPDAADVAQVRKRIYKLEYDLEANATEASRQDIEKKRLAALSGSWRLLSWVPTRNANANDYDPTRANDKPSMNDPGWSHQISPQPNESASVTISGSHFEADIRFFNNDRARYVGEIQGTSVKGKMTYALHWGASSICPGYAAEFPFEGIVDADANRIMLLSRGHVDAEVVGKCYTVIDTWGWNSRMLFR